jgi:universal stress protein E
MRSIRQILLAIKDPELPSAASIEKAAQLAKACGARLELFHALSKPLYATSYDYAGAHLKQLQNEVRARCLSQLEKVAQRLGARDIKVTVGAEWDFPAYEAVVRRAMRIKADLIIVEQHGGRHIAPRLLQLTDWELLRASPVPVLLVKGPQRYRRPTVLAAVDPAHQFAKPSGLDAQIVQTGKFFAQALRGSLHAVHAFNPLPLGTLPAEVMSAEIINEIEEKAAAKARAGFERILRKSGIRKSRGYLVEGPAADAIERTARKTNSAIVVMGSISRSGLKRIFIGNTAEHVLDQLGCDVLLIKPPRFASKVARAERGARLVATQVPPFAY